MALHCLPAYYQDMDMTDNNDTTSHITTTPRHAPVQDDTGEYGGTVQVFTSVRGTEVAAEEAITNPPSDGDAIDFEALCAAMREKEMVWCHGRCQTFKHKSLFSADERNPGRLYCKSYCRECEAARFHGKYMAQREIQAVMRYEYRARNKRRKRN